MAQRSPVFRVGYVVLAVVSESSQVPIDDRTVIINSDDTLLSGRSGQSPSILQMAGGDVRREMDSLLEKAGGKLALGRVYTTKGGASGAGAILHITTVDHVDGALQTQDSCDSASLLVEVLERAAELNARHVVLPLPAETPWNSLEDELRSFTYVMMDFASTRSPVARVTLVLNEGRHDLFRSVELDKWLACTPKLPSLAKLVPSRRPEMRRALGVAAKESRGNHQLTKLCAAVTHGLEAVFAPLTDKDELLDAAMAALWPEDGCGTSNDLDLWRFFSEDRIWGSVRRDIGQYVRAMHRLVANRLFEIAAPSEFTHEVEVSDMLFGRASVLVDTAKFKQLAPPLPDPRTLAGLSSGRPAYTPVGRLARLLLNETIGEDRAELMRRIRRPGRAGADLELMIEHLLDVSPSEPLQDLSTRRLRDMTRSLRIASEPRDRDACIDAILAVLGFKIARPVPGLAEFSRQVVEQRRAFERDGSHAEAAVQEAARTVERVAKHLLAFHCRNSFHAEVDELAHREKWLSPEESHQRCSLGMLLELVSRLDNALAQEEAAPARRFQDIFGKQRFRVPVAMAQYRNECVHDRDFPRTSIARSATAFFELAEAWLRHLGEGPQPLFPRVIQIRGERVDCWGRRTFDAINDAGESERLHVMLEHDIGANYFMCPRSNPIRVFPLLIRVD